MCSSSFRKEKAEYGIRIFPQQKKALTKILNSARSKQRLLRRASNQSFTYLDRLQKWEKKVFLSNESRNVRKSPVRLTFLTTSRPRASFSVESFSTWNRSSMERIRTSASISFRRRATQLFPEPGGPRRITASLRRRRPARGITSERGTIEGFISPSRLLPDTRSLQIQAKTFHLTNSSGFTAITS